jgi:hypothetical protein
VRRLLAALTAAFVVVAATGVHQAFRYRPDGSQWWSDVHRWSSIVLVLALLATLFVWLRERPALRRGAVQVVALAVAAVAVVAGYLTGTAIHWDQLALGTVSVGADVRGVFEGGVEFVVADGQVLGVDTFRRSVWAHVVVLPVVFAVALAVVWYLSRRASLGAPGEESVEVAA